MLGVALAIKLESPGLIVFCRKRVGLNGSIFAIWIFRSNAKHPHPDACAADEQGRSGGNTGRPRRSGFEHRRLAAVVECHPRAHALDTRVEGRLHEVFLEGYAARHRVKPGITGWAQIKGLRGELGSVRKLKQRVKHDLKYIEK
jgi:lipopolysaccharide/colanic/teichoic acid biosynthesis glycosyltransferase